MQLQWISSQISVGPLCERTILRDCFMEHEKMIFWKEFGFTVHSSRLVLKNHDSYTRLSLIPAASNLSFKCKCISVAMCKYSPKTNDALTDDAIHIHASLL